MSGKSIKMILELLTDAFEHAKIPSSFYAAKKTITKLGLNYTKIHACPNNCMLYWGEDESRETCKVCNKSIWKSRSKDVQVEASNIGGNKQKVGAKILRYFPLKQRLFLSSKTADDMKWHVVDCNKDGLMRHLRGSEAWKRLATDGFNPFGTLSASYSIWSVILVPYNTPPWMCMKQTSFIISMIIPSKKMSGNDIDVYLKPLIKELKELWDEGVNAYVASKREMFKLHAALTLS